MIISIIKKWMHYLYTESTALSFRNILSLAEPNSSARILDLGCDDGSWTLQFAKKIGSKNISAIEIVSERAELARQKGISVAEADLEKKWPYPDSSFDVVHANFTIEHLSNIDHFMSEISRVSTPPGRTRTPQQPNSQGHF